mmetsp:Transcript_130096/g.316070  ORF Transcript_130096/g.316070 Transcript_130096/m.316070 type:complete len:371 (-) Transcript_130096:460-1572(-)
MLRRPDRRERRVHPRTRRGPGSPVAAPARGAADAVEEVFQSHQRDVRIQRVLDRHRQGRVRPRRQVRGHGPVQRPRLDRLRSSDVQGQARGLRRIRNGVSAAKRVEVLDSRHGRPARQHHGVRRRGHRRHDKNGHRVRLQGRERSPGRGAARAGGAADRGVVRLRRRRREDEDDQLPRGEKHVLVRGRHARQDAPLRSHRPRRDPPRGRGLAAVLRSGHDVRTEDVPPTRVAFHHARGSLDRRRVGRRHRGSHRKEFRHHAADHRSPRDSTRVQVEGGLAARGLDLERAGERQLCRRRAASAAGDAGAAGAAVARGRATFREDRHDDVRSSRIQHHHDAGDVSARRDTRGRRHRGQERAAQVPRRVRSGL